MSLLPIEWAISDDFASAGMLAAKAGGLERGPGGASHPWRDIMRHRFFHGFGSENVWVAGIGTGIRFSERGSGTGALRKPGNLSGIRVVPADSVPPWAGRTPWAENIAVPFPPPRLGKEPKNNRSSLSRGRRYNGRNFCDARDGSETNLTRIEEDLLREISSFRIQRHRRIFRNPGYPPGFFFSRQWLFSPCPIHSRLFYPIPL